MMHNLLGKLTYTAQLYLPNLTSSFPQAVSTVKKEQILQGVISEWPNEISDLGKSLQ